MGKIFHIIDEGEEMRRDYPTRGYNQRESEDKMLERVFKEGCEHGYKKAMREIEGYNERKGHHYGEDFEEKLEKLRKKYE